jgi:predicted HicB family RNase H-like nuclease
LSFLDFSSIVTKYYKYTVITVKHLDSKKIYSYIVNTYLRVQPIQSDMQHKQKVTLYIQPELHRQLKIRAAVDARSMSTLVEKALHFYLHHSDVVEETEAVTNKSYQVHSCPDCQGSFVIKDGHTVSLKNQPSFIDEEFSLDIAQVTTALPVEESSKESLKNNLKNNLKDSTVDNQDQTEDHEKLVIC